MFRKRARAGRQERPSYRCSFCGKGQADVRRLVAGPNNVFVCDECVALCDTIIAEEEGGLSRGAARQERPLALGLYVVTDERLARGRPTTEIVRAALRGGADAIQLRGKELSAREQLLIGCELRALTREAGALLIVNDRADLAVALDADGVHVGQDDLPADLARRIVGPRRIVGVSVATSVEAVAARDAGADYLGVGSIYPTTTKPDAGEAVGPALIGAIRAAVDLPIVGIGGIRAENAAAVIAAGAVGVAVVGAVVAADEPELAARELAAIIARAHEDGGDG